MACERCTVAFSLAIFGLSPSLFLSKDVRLGSAGEQLWLAARASCGRVASNTVHLQNRIGEKSSHPIAQARWLLWVGNRHRRQHRPMPALLRGADTRRTWEAGRVHAGAAQAVGAARLRCCARSGGSESVLGRCPCWPASDSSRGFLRPCGIAPGEPPGSRRRPAPGGLSSDSRQPLACRLPSAGRSMRRRDICIYHRVEAACSGRACRGGFALQVGLTGSSSRQFRRWRDFTEDASNIFFDPRFAAVPK